MISITYITLVLAILTLVAVTATILTHRGKKESSEEVKEIKRRICRPKYSSIPSNPEDEREKEVDRLLEKKSLSLAEMQYIYDFLMDTGKEKWRYIKGYEGYYRVSSTGVIESCRFSRYLDPYVQMGKYHVTVCVDRTSKGLLVHRIVAETFIPNPSGAVSVVPKDGDYRHCDVRNLMWKPRAAISKTVIKMAMKEAA